MTPTTPSPRRPGRRPLEPLVPLGLTLLLHAGAGVWLLRPLTQGPAAQAPLALQVVWIERPSPPPDAPDPPPLRANTPEPPASPHRPMPLPTTASTALQAVDAATPPAPTAPAIADARDLLQQASDWASTQAPAADFEPDFLQHRQATIPGERFAMRHKVTAADVVAGIGQVFGGPGYTTDPCPQIRRNLARESAAGGDTALAAEEVRRLRRFCL